MDGASVTLTVYHDGQFFVGLVERVQGDRLTVSRIVFGAEPSDEQVREFIAQSWFALRFSPPVDAAARPKAVNPKRMQREIAREVNSSGTGTKSQQALQLLREQNKLERQVKSREQREAEKLEAFRLRQEKKKEKRRGH